jgi:hypothetical protein
MTVMILMVVVMMKSILDLSVAVMRGRISCTVMDRMFLCGLNSDQSQKS